jgi:hypothetical protein
MTQYEGNSYATENDYIYLLGSYNKGHLQKLHHDVFSLSEQNKNHIVARTIAKDLLNEDTNKIEIMIKNSESNIIEWITIKTMIESDLQPHVIVAKTMSECTFYFDKSLSKWLIVSMLSVSTLDICESDTVEGPWTCKSLAPPVVRSDGSVITYAAHVHPELTNPKNGMVISYLSNIVKDPSGLFASSYRDVYIPKFVLYCGLNLCKK